MNYKKRLSDLLLIYKQLKFYGVMSGDREHRRMAWKMYCKDHHPNPKLNNCPLCNKADVVHVDENGFHLSNGDSYMFCDRCGVSFYGNYSYDGNNTHVDPSTANERLKKVEDYVRRYRYRRDFGCNETGDNYYVDHLLDIINGKIE